MTKPELLYIDEYGAHLRAKTLRELQNKAGGGRISKMYLGEKHIGYVVGQRWFTAYKPVVFGE